MDYRFIEVSLATRDVQAQRRSPTCEIHEPEDTQWYPGRSAA